MNYILFIYLETDFFIFSYVWKLIYLELVHLNKLN